MRSFAGIGENSIQYSPVGHGGTQAVTPRQGAVPNVTEIRMPTSPSRYLRLGKCTSNLKQSVRTSHSRPSVLSVGRSWKLRFTMDFAYSSGGILDNAILLFDIY